MKYTIYFYDEVDSFVEDIVINFQSRQSAMKFFSKKYPTKAVTNVVKDYDGFSINTKLEDLSMLEIHLVGYLFHKYTEYYNSDYITNAKVTDFKREFTKKLNLDYFSDINKYICYSLFDEYSKSNKIKTNGNIIFSIINNEFIDILKGLN